MKSEMTPSKKRARKAVEVPRITCEQLSTGEMKYPAVAYDAKAERLVFRNVELPKARAYENAESRVPRGSFGGPLPIVSWQRNQRGTREYTVTSWPAFWAHYRTLAPVRRQYYEIVRAGLPCKLFFDIDVAYEPDDADALAALRARTAALAGWVSDQLEAVLEWTGSGSEAGLMADRVVWLDSSAPAQGKFSVHLVWNLTTLDDTVGALLFEDPADVQALVEWLHVTAIACEVPCWWKPVANAKAYSERAREDALIDFAVHTHGDREFRLVYSAKPPKEAGAARRFLRPVPFDGSQVPRAEDFDAAAAAALTRQELDAEAFFASLVTFLPAPRYVAGMLKVHLDASAVNSSGRLHGVPGDVDTKRPRGLGGGVGGGARALRGLDAMARQVLDYVRAGMEAVCPDAATLTLQRYYDRPDRWCAVFRSTNHYCELQGRTHRSNGVYYVCWLATGRFYQRCLDPDCAAEYRTDLAAEIQERAAAYRGAKAGWSPEECQAEEQYLEERRAMAQNPELRARGEVYTLEPTLALPGREEPFPLWQALLAFAQLRHGVKDAPDDPEGTPPSRPTLHFDTAVPLKREPASDDESDGSGGSLDEAAMDGVLALDESDGLAAIFA